MQGMINGVQDIQNCHASRVANHHGETGRSGEDDAEICERRGSSGQGECWSGVPFVTKNDGSRWAPEVIVERSGGGGAQQLVQLDDGRRCCLR